MAAKCAAEAGLTAPETTYPVATVSGGKWSIAEDSCLSKALAAQPRTCLPDGQYPLKVELRPQSSIDGH